MRAVFIVFAGLLALAAASSDFGGFANQLPGLDALATDGGGSYVVSIRRNGEHACVGSVITERLVLTAASCIAADPTPANLSVTTHSSRHRIVASRYPDNYADLSNDIALVRVSPAFEIGAFANKIRLASELTTTPGGANATGWEGRQAREPESVRLRLVQCPVPESLICAAPTNGDTCQLEIGGPLVVDDVQLGIKSRGFGRFSQQNPAFYTDVSRHHQWIHEKIQLLNSIDEGMDFLTYLTRVIN